MKNNFGADLKIVVVGNSGTGKTSFVNKWTKNTFSEKYKATIVSEFGYKIVNLNGVVYRVQVWDLAGQDKNTCVTKIFCKDAHGAVIISDCTDRNSLIETEKWKLCIEDNSRFVDGSEMPIILIDNKSDLLNEVNNPLSEFDLKDFAKKNRFTESFRTSAKNGININESMDYLIKTIVIKLNNLNPDNLKKNENKNKIKLNKNTLNTNNKKGCC